MISAIVLTKDEEKNIIDCLESLNFCDEIIVLDDNSNDRTVEIAKKTGAEVFVHPLSNDFSKQRNYGLSKIKGDWALFIDADERVSDVLAREVAEVVTLGNKYNGFFIKRIDTIWGKRILHGELTSVWKLRIARRDSGKWVGSVHESWFVKGKIGKLKNTLDHYPHQSIADFLREINFYTDIRAKELYNLGVKVKWYSILLYPKGKFLLNYFLKLGFIDGIPGLLVVMMMSFHSFLVRGKLWLLNQKS